MPRTIAKAQPTVSARRSPQERVVSAAQWSQFTDYFAGLPLVELGKVTGGPNVVIRGTAAETVIDSPWADLKRAWKEPLAWE